MRLCLCETEKESIVTPESTIEMGAEGIGERLNIKQVEIRIDVGCEQLTKLRNRILLRSDTQI